MPWWILYPSHALTGGGEQIEIEGVDRTDDIEVRADIDDVHEPIRFGIGIDTGAIEILPNERRLL